MKTVIYSTQTSDFEVGVEYRNPRFFRAPLGQPDRVKIVGNWPEVAEAYRAAGVEVEAVGDDAELTIEAIEKMKKADLIAAHVGLGADPEQTEAKTVAVLREELIAAVTANE